jgi:prevent-host-death family protein
MNSKTKEVKLHDRDLIKLVSRGEEVIITYRGKPYAKIVPLKESKKKAEKSTQLFGIWKNRKDLAEVDLYIREMRKGRI